MIGKIKISSRRGLYLRQRQFIETTISEEYHYKPYPCPKSKGSKVMTEQYALKTNTN